MAALGAVGESARVGVHGGGPVVKVPLGFLGGFPYGAIGRNGGPSNSKAITAIALVRYSTAVTATSQATLTATFPTAPTQGHTLIAIASSDATVTMTSSGWTLVGSVINFTGHYMWTKTAGASESTTVTITPGATTTVELFIAELSGTSASALDVSATNDPSVNASTIATGTTGATGQADEITFASFSWNDSTGFGATLSSVANTSGAVAPKLAILANLRGTDPTSMDTFLGVAYRFTPAAGAQSATATLSNTGGRPTGIIATFKAAGATSHVSTTWASSYVTRARVRPSWQSRYVVRHHTSTVWASSYTVRIRGPVSWQSRYTTRARGTASWQTRYVTRARTQTNWASSYLVIGHRTQAWPSRYTITDHTSAAWTSGYVVKAHRSTVWASGYVTRTRSPIAWQSRWTTRRRTPVTWISTYSVEGHRTTIWQSRWVTRERISVTWASRYTVTAHPTILWATSYTVTAHPTVAWQSSYRVRTGITIGHRTTIDALERLPAGIVVRGIELVGT